MDENFTSIREDFRHSKFSASIGLQLEDMKEGRVTLVLPFRESFENMQQTVHGGVYATMLDTVMGMTCRTLGYAAAITIQMSIQFLKPVRHGKIFADAAVISQSGKTVYAEGRLFNEQNEMVAHSTGTFRVLNEENAL